MRLADFFAFSVHYDSPVSPLIFCIVYKMSLICVLQVLTVSSCVPPKVCAALCAAEEATLSVEELLQKERLLSNTLQQVHTLTHQHTL